MGHPQVSIQSKSEKLWPKSEELSNNVPPRMALNGHAHTRNGNMNGNVVNFGAFVDEVGDDDVAKRDKQKKKTKTKTKVRRKSLTKEKSSKQRSKQEDETKHKRSHRAVAKILLDELMSASNTNCCEQKKE